MGKERPAWYKIILICTHVDNFKGGLDKQTGSDNQEVTTRKWN